MVGGAVIKRRKNIWYKKWKTIGQTGNGVIPKTSADRKVCAWNMNGFRDWLPILLEGGGPNGLIVK